jgi:hypothetical protein
MVKKKDSLHLKYIKKNKKIINNIKNEKLEGSRQRFRQELTSFRIRVCVLKKKNSFFTTEVNVGIGRKKK